MGREIFRKEAIDRMASPDRVDQPLRLVKPINWMFLAVGAAIILFALVWGFTTSVPIKVEVRGILIGANGLSEVSAQYGGQVEEVLVQPGQRVRAGEVIARLSRGSREREIRAAEAALREAIETSATSEDVFRRGESNLGSAEAAMIGSIEARIVELRSQLRTRQETVDNLRALIEQNAATSEELAEVMALRDSIRSEIRQLEQQRLDIGVTAAGRGNERGQSRLGEGQLVAQRRRELRILRAQTGDEAVLRAAQAGEVIEIKVNRGDVLQPGDSVATIDARAEGARREDGFEAVLYAPPSQGKRVAAGMRVEIVPTTAEREIYGHINGEVASVTIFPASRAAMRRYLQNDQLVEQLSSEGPPIEMRIRLRRADQPSGFAWSSSQGPDWPITRGTLLEGAVVIENRPLIDVILPGLRGRVSRTVRTAPASGASE